MKRRISIRPKIFLYLIGFCALLLVILWLFQTVFLDSFYKAIVKNDVRTLAESIAAAVQRGDETAWKQTVAERGDVMVELWSETGGVVDTVQDQNPGGRPFKVDEGERRELLEKARAQGGFVTLLGKPDWTDMALGLPGAEKLEPPGGSWMRDMMDRESVLYACVVVKDGGELLLTVSAEITPVSATVATLRVQLVYISLLMMLLASALALLISSRVAKPIRRLNSAAAQWGDGDYAVRFEGGGYSEIEQLADTLNSAAGELAKTEALRRELVANVGHDLRTPLSLMTGYAEMMRDIPGELTPENLQVIADEGKRLTTLVAELLEFSQLQSGTGEIHPQPMNLTASVEDSLARIGKLAESGGFAVAFDHGADAWILADENRVGQVLYNFVINAMAHSGGAKQVQVVQKRKACRVVLEVCDKGPGIPAAQLPHIWERYYKAGSDRQGPAGSGLGLAIAKSILELHPGAEYGVRSQSGMGSVFWFSFPEIEAGQAPL